MVAAASRRLTYKDYLSAAQASDVKLEWRDGVVVAMSGGTVEHARLGSAVQRLLGSALEGKPCVVLSSDVRVRVEKTNRAFYPDAIVICARVVHAQDDPDAVVNPVVIVEVLSESTEGYDRGEKARHYRHLSSLREYVLVSQTEPLVEIWEPEGRSWRTRDYTSGERFELRSLGVTIAVDDLYRNPLDERPGSEKR